MSNRHRSSKQAAPGATHLTPNKEQRRAENRKARHRTHELLAHADMEAGEEIVTPRPHHTGIDVKPDEEAETKPKVAREYRHWKQKFWKRRSNQRAERAAMTRQEPPLPEVG
ncbi:MAG: hypothetical protein ACSLFO_09915 [Acidimicrobiales bacterium]